MIVVRKLKKNVAGNALSWGYDAGDVPAKDSEKDQVASKGEKDALFCSLCRGNAWSLFVVDLFFDDCGKK